VTSGCERPPSWCDGWRRGWRSSISPGAGGGNRAADGSARRFDLAGRPSVILVVGVNAPARRPRSASSRGCSTSTVGAARSRGGYVSRGRRRAAPDLAERAQADFVGERREAILPPSPSTRSRPPRRALRCGDRRHRRALAYADQLDGELIKIRRVIAAKLEGAPHETLLVIDATTGQNGLQQARLFAEAVGVTGVALTKLDGSAKAAWRGDRLRARFAVKLIGLGEQLDDLRRSIRATSRRRCCAAEPAPSRQSRASSGALGHPSENAIESGRTRLCQNRAETQASTVRVGRGQWTLPIPAERRPRAGNTGLLAWVFPGAGSPGSAAAGCAGRCACSYRSSS